MGKPSTYRLTSLVILPFRGEVEAGVTDGTLAGDSEPTRFELSYQTDFQIPPDFEVPTRHCTYITVEFPQQFNESVEQFKKWVTNNAATRVVPKEVIPRVNHFLAAIQAADPQPYRTIALRNVGELDLFFYNITLEAEVLYARGTSSFFGLLDSVKEIRGSATLPQPVPERMAAEWLLVTRAVHLANHGFHSEAVLVAFSLLDLKVQEFLAPRFSHLDAGEGKELLRAVESQRLNRYLGLMMRLATGTSPLDDPNNASDLKWLNDLRNDLIHRAGGCSISEAQRALGIVKGLLESLNEHGAKLELPDLRFWTEDV